MKYKFYWLNFITDKTQRNPLGAQTGFYKTEIFETITDSFDEAAKDFKKVVGIGYDWQKVEKIEKSKIALDRVSRI